MKEFQNYANALVNVTYITTVRVQFNASSNKVSPSCPTMKISDFVDFIALHATVT